MRANTTDPRFARLGYNTFMRKGAALLVLCVVAVAGDNPFPTGHKILKDKSERISVKVPKKWRSSAISGNIVLRASGRYGGGHDLLIVREEDQSDVDAQRDRYLKYDSGQYAGAEVKKVDEPYYGYRMNIPGQSKVIVRAFVADGDDGLVISCSSPLKMYDDRWAKQIEAIVASVNASTAGDGTAAPEAKARRVYDTAGLVSLVAPGKWKPLKPKASEQEVIFLGLKGSRTGPAIRLLERGDVSNPNLVITSLATEWRQTYGSGLTVRKLKGAPPRIIVSNRKTGWMDYVVGLTAGGKGYALALSVRKGSFEKFRAVADEVAKSIVFLVGGYRDPTEVPGDIHKALGKKATVHAATAHEIVLGVVAKTVTRFDKRWSRAGVGRDKKATPLHVHVVTAEEFGAASDGFGEPPAAFNPRTSLVVVTSPPAEKQKRGSWTGRVFAALAEASLARDLGARCPPWLRAGLVACMEAAGRTGEKPNTAHPGYVAIVIRKTDAESQPSLHEITNLSHAVYLKADTPDNAAFAWAYTSAMLFGKGEPNAMFRKWRKLLEGKGKGKGKGAPRTVPALKTEKAEAFLKDFKKHLEREWRRS